jgi:NAD(P)-dependent dehydrogenase (short-subunit alcohol dehydrogenase family)
VPSADPSCVIVTGGASGLGAVVAHAIHDAGMTPVVFDLAPSANGFASHSVDVADTRATEAAVDAVAREHGGLRGVVAAAGIDACGRLDHLDRAPTRASPTRTTSRRPSCSRFAARRASSCARWS